MMRVKQEIGESVALPRPVARNPRLSIVIPSLNGMSYLPACLSSAVSDCSTIQGGAEIIVVDNGSTDETVSFLQQEYPDVRILRLSSNHGFAEPCDRGIRAAHGNYCLLLNNDTWIAPGCLAILLDYAERGDYAFAGPAILNPDGTLQCGPMAIDFLGEPDQRAQHQPPFYASGAALLVRRSDYVELGGFDCRFFAFYEETDIQWRAQIAGKRIGYAPLASVYHRGGSTLAGALLGTDETVITSRQRLYLGRRNQLVMLLVNYSREFLAWVLPVWILSALIECLGAAVIGHTGHTRIYAAAISWNIRNMPCTLKRRRAIQRSRVVADRAILRLFAHPFVRLRTALRLIQHGRRVLVQ